MKALNIVCIFIAITFSVYAQGKVSPEEKAARRAWVEKHKTYPPDAKQEEIVAFYKSLPKSTQDSLTLFEMRLDYKFPPKDSLATPPYKFIPIPPSEGKEKVITIPVYVPSIKKED